MTPPLPALDPDIEQLLGVARARLEGPAQARQRVAERLVRSILVLPVEAPVGSAIQAAATSRRAARVAAWLAGRPWLSVAATFALGAMAGAGAYRLLEPVKAPRVVFLDRAPPVVPVQPVVSRVELPAAAGNSAVPPAAENVAPRGSAVSSPRRPSTTRTASLDAERVLLDVARRALTEGRPADAFDPLRRHSTEFPNGILAEEREAIAINALVGVARYEEARARAQSFLRRFPNSLLRASVEAALAAIP